MKRLIAAVCLGMAASLGGLLIGLSQPGSWVAQVAGISARGYDIFIHDRYLILQPAVFMVNVVLFAIVAYAAMRLWRERPHGQNGGAGA